MGKCESKRGGTACKTGVYTSKRTSDKKYRQIKRRYKYWEHENAPIFKGKKKWSIGI